MTRGEEGEDGEEGEEREDVGGEEGDERERTGEECVGGGPELGSGVVMMEIGEGMMLRSVVVLTTPRGERADVASEAFMQQEATVTNTGRVLRGPR